MAHSLSKELSALKEKITTLQNDHHAMKTACLKLTDENKKLFQDLENKRGEIKRLDNQEVSDNTLIKELEQLKSTLVLKEQELLAKDDEIEKIIAQVESLLS